MKKFLQELKRRNVFKSALAYLVVAWLITQVMDIIVPAFQLPAPLLKYLIIIIILCFPFWIIFSWTYEITPDGIKKTVSVNPDSSITPQTGNRLNKIIIAVLVIAIGLLTYNIISKKQILSTSQMTDALPKTDTIDKYIAVLAFADMSPGNDQGYFSDGISEEILNLLTKIPALKVISRTSSFSYKGKGFTIKKIGEELQVDHILEGSIRKSDSVFRITAQLIDVNTGAQIWSETYDRNLEDIFKIQDEIASKVTQQLKISLLGIELASTKTNTEAYTLYLQAKQLIFEKSQESNINAIKLNKESIAIDSTYAPAWSLLSSLYYQAAFRFATIPMDDAIKKGKEAAKKAIALDPKFVIGYLNLADFENASWNFKKANKLMEKALSLDPNNLTVITAEADFALQNGNIDLAIELLLKTKELDPLNEIIYFYLGFYYWMNGEFAKAEENMNQYLFLYPNAGFANGNMAQIQLSLGNPEAAQDFLKKNKDPFWHLYRKSMVVFALGNPQEANELLAQLIADYGNDSWPNIANVYAFRNEKDEAFKWLEITLENKDSSLLEILNYPAMKNLWGDPRWNKFIEKLELPENHGFHLD